MTDSRRGIVALWLLVGVAALAVTYIATSPALFAASVTEVYVLNERGVAADYPDELAVGDYGTVLVGVHNDRPNGRSYTVVVSFADRTVDRYVVDLDPGERDERWVSFRPRQTGSYEFRVAVYSGDREGGDPRWEVGFPVVVESDGA